MEQSGFEITREGDWDDVVDFCGKVSSAMESASVRGYERFEDWRPKREEDPGEMRERTVEEESIGTTKFEEESDGMRKEFSRAGGEVRDSGSELVQGRPRESMKKVGEAGNSTAKGAVPLLARLVRGVERGIYRHVVEPTNPDYFESSAVSASIEKRGVRERRYRCRIIFDDADVRRAVVSNLEQ